MELTAFGFSMTAGKDGVLVTFRDKEGQAVTVTIPHTMFRDFYAMAARTDSYLSTKRWLRPRSPSSG